MDELKIVRLSEMRSRMSGIPVKMIVTFLFAAGMVWQFSMDKFKEDIPQSIFTLFVVYGILSYVWFCIKLTRNWIIGIIIAIVFIFLYSTNLDKLGGVWGTLIGMAICFGGPMLDILTIIRYFFLKKSLFAEMAEYEHYEDDECEDNEYEEEEYDDEEYYEEDEYDDEEDEEYEEYQRQQARRERRKQEMPSPGFFSGCRDSASIKRRYRDLCKVYHPDAGNGSSEVFHKITEEYNRLMEGA